MTPVDQLRDQLRAERARQLKLRAEGDQFNADLAGMKIDRLLDWLFRALPVTSGVTMPDHGDPTG